MFCKNCGHNIAPSEQICPFCAEKSGFPKGMVGDEELLAVREAKAIVGDVSFGADSYGKPAVSSAPRKREERAFADEQATTIFSIDEVNAALNTPTTADEYDEYDDYDDEYYDNKKPPFPFTNSQIMIIGGGALIVLVLIIILLLSKCGGDDTSGTPTSKENETSFVSSEVIDAGSSSSGSSTTSSDTSSATSSESSSNVSSDTSSDTSSNASSETPSTSSELTPEEKGELGIDPGL